MTITVYGKDIQVPNKIDYYYHSDPEFKNQFDYLMRSTINIVKDSSQSRVHRLFNTSPKNIIDTEN